jgi:hypothetical protein
MEAVLQFLADTAAILWARTLGFAVGFVVQAATIVASRASSGALPSSAAVGCAREYTVL